MGKLTEIGVPIERRTPDPAYTGPEYYVVGHLSDAPPLDIDRRGPFAPTRLASVMMGPSPQTTSSGFEIPEEGATTVTLTERTSYPRGKKPYRHSDLHQVARVALWTVPVALAGGAALGFWFGRRRKS